MFVHEKVKQPLDKEWVELMKEAFALGLSMEEIRSFLGQIGILIWGLFFCGKEKLLNSQELFSIYGSKRNITVMFS